MLDTFQTARNPLWIKTAQPTTHVRKITERSERNMDAKTDDSAGKCPFTHGTRGHRNRDWWPEHLDIGVLHAAHPSADPMGKGFDYAKELKTLHLDAVIKDLHALMRDSQPWWPADFGPYGGLFIRLAWHS